MMPTHAHERAAFERFFVPGAAPMRGPEVLSEQALFARYFGAEAANQPVAPVVAKAIPTPVVAPVAPPVQAPVPAKPAAPPAAKAEVVEAPVSFFARVKQGLSRTRSGLTDGLASLLLGKKAIDDELLEDIETQLLTADVGVEATRKLLDAITARLKRKELADSDALYKALQEEMAAILTRADGGGGFHIDTSKKPYVILMVGVNGVGKTTTIGKLAKKLQQEGKSVMLAAGDTFRAAAVEQLQVWGERNNIQVVAQHTGADSASVIFDAVQAAKARGIDVLIADTAGRLHTKDNLMEELKKVRRVIGK